MNKIKFTFFLNSTIFLFLLVSCGDNNDKTPPEINILSSSPDPASTEICGQLEESAFQLFSYDSLQFSLLVLDNNELSQIKFDIHNNFDCHGHGGGQAPGFEPPDVMNQTQDWTLLEIIDLDESSEEVNITMPVPDNVTTGTYHFGIQALDAAGNESSNIIYDLKAINAADTEAPEIVMEKPQSMQLQLSKGEQITFKGKVQDNRSLENGGNAIVFLTYENEETENHFTGPFLVFEEGAGAEASFSLEFAFPQTVVEGSYKLFVNAHDGVRNIATAVVYDIQLSN